jgi:hypothetical protein
MHARRLDVLRAAVVHVADRVDERGDAGGIGHWQASPVPMHAQWPPPASFSANVLPSVHTQELPAPCEQSKQYGTE